MQERGSSEGTAAWKRGTEIPREAPREEGSKREWRSQVGREPWGAGRGRGEGEEQPGEGGEGQEGQAGGELRQSRERPVKGTGQGQPGREGEPAGREASGEQTMGEVETERGGRRL